MKRKSESASGTTQQRLRRPTVSPGKFAVHSHFQSAIERTVRQRSRHPCRSEQIFFVPSSTVFQSICILQCSGTSTNIFFLVCNLIAILNLSGRQHSTLHIAGITFLLRSLTSNSIRYELIRQSKQLINSSSIILNFTIV